MGRNLIETVMGAVVLVVAAVFVFFAYRMAEVQAAPGYKVDAIFYRIGGLTTGSDVRISGIKVGTVTDSRLDTKTFDAVVVMSIESNVKLPDDTTATITSEGLLGGKYVRLDPGQSKKMIADGGRIVHTNDFQSLEDQVGQIIFLATGGQDGKK